MELARSTFPILLNAMICNLPVISRKGVACATGLHVVAFPFFQRQPLCLITPRLKAESISRHFKVQSSLMFPFYGLFSDPVFFDHNVLRFFWMFCKFQIETPAIRGHQLRAQPRRINLAGFGFITTALRDLFTICLGKKRHPNTTGVGVQLEPRPGG